jgi:hypothetical protein
MDGALRESFCQYHQEYKKAWLGQAQEKTPRDRCVCATNRGSRPEGAALVEAKAAH